MLELKNLLDPANIIGRGADISTLKECLAFTLGNDRRRYFNYTRPISGMDYSIRVVGEKPFEECAVFYRPLSPDELAESLLKLSDARQEEGPARYPQRPSSSSIKGWTISRSVDDVDEEGNPLIAAYATWMD